MIAKRKRGSDQSRQLDVALAGWLEDHPPCGVLVSDESGCVRVWNRWMETHTGRVASDVIGRSLADAFPELVERGLLHYFDEALIGQIRLLSQRLHGFLIRMPTNSGGGRFECMQQSGRIAPLLAEGQVVGAIATITDVTDRVVREAELKSELATRARLLVDERASRADADSSNRAKDEFLGVLSHELRTPLHSILAWARVLREERLAPENLSRGLETIERNAKLQAQLVEDLLDMSLIISGDLRIELEPVSLRHAIEAGVLLVRPDADSKGVQLSVSIADDVGIGLVVGDAGRLQQIVGNLLSNTVKFTPSGGEVSLVATSDDGHVSFSVTDTGEGIAPELLPHVFDRFRQSDSTTARRQGGLGLGLSIVKRLVELHGGTVTAASKGVGLGATFRVTLPRAGADQTLPPSSRKSAAGAPIGAPSNAGLLAGVRILFVDDDPDGREIMAMALVAEGALVVIAGSAEEARVALSRERPDVLISDIGMPGEDGYALIRSVRNTMPLFANTPAIALTGYAGLEDQRRARDSGFDAHHSKPVDLALLFAQVARAVGR